MAYIDYRNNGVYFISFSKDDGLYRYLSNSLLGLETLMARRESLLLALHQRHEAFGLPKDS
jgi:hypothetical protein